ncbi:hypothetical protein LEP1GSC088_0199 [Leptospira interrogans str. L1207]|nr:hypothetical protein LEP1GSC088_0199 [Leptospira interrogans str. L1207]
MKSYPKPSIRPKVLQKYHETTYGGLPLSAEAIANATFEEYHALYRLEYPKVFRWRAAMSAPRDDFRSLTSQFKPDMKSPLQMLDWPQFKTRRSENYMFLIYISTKIRRITFCAREYSRIAYDFERATIRSGFPKTASVSKTFHYSR